MSATNAPLETRIRPYGTAAIAEAAALILAGQPVAIATETVYGLAADATDGAAVARIYAAKGRPSFNPLIVHVADLAAAERLAVFDDQARCLAAAFWPGPLTLVLPRTPDCPVATIATAGLATIAIRVPAHPAMQALLAACGRPLAAPSANASGGISPTRAGHVLSGLGGRISLIVDAGPTAHGLESTIVAPGLHILRPGPITRANLAAWSPANAGAQRSPLPLPGITSPGQLASHYAPTKPIAIDVTTPPADAFVIGFAPTADFVLSATGDLIEAAANLFDALHAADASDRPTIAVTPIPRDGIGEAINDRLTRAAANP